jgi:hypothetical protein
MQDLIFIKLAWYKSEFRGATVVSNLAFSYRSSTDRGLHRGR